MTDVRALWHRLSRQPHDWQFWSRLEDGQSPSMFGLPPVPNVLIVERCSFYPSCRAVRSFRYEPLVPESFVSAIVAASLAPNPYRSMFR